MLELKWIRWAACALVLFLLLGGCTVSVRNGEEPKTPAVEAESGTSESTSGAGSGYPLGPPRGDLQRFYGVYGDSSEPGRDFFVTEARRPRYAEQAEEIPPGYLMIGAMWGDVAPWYMKSVSDTTFEQVWVPDYVPEGIKVDFEVGEDGTAAAIMFQTVFSDRGRLQRIGELPEEWR